MKKVISLIVAIVMMSAVCVQADVNLSMDRIKRPHGNIQFNVNVGTRELPDYYPMRIMIDFTPQTSEGVPGKQITIKKNVGTNRNTPFVFSTKAGLKEVYLALPAWAQSAFKEGVLAVIAEDASQ